MLTLKPVSQWDDPSGKKSLLKIRRKLDLLPFHTNSTNAKDLQKAFDSYWGKQGLSFAPATPNAIMRNIRKMIGL